MTTRTDTDAPCGHFKTAPRDKPRPGAKSEPKVEPPIPPLVPESLPEPERIEHENDLA